MFQQGQPARCMCCTQSLHPCTGAQALKTAGTAVGSIAAAIVAVAVVVLLAGVASRVMVVRRRVRAMRVGSPYPAELMSRACLTSSSKATPLFTTSPDLQLGKFSTQGPWFVNTASTQCRACASATILCTRKCAKAPEPKYGMAHKNQHPAHSILSPHSLTRQSASDTVLPRCTPCPGPCSEATWPADPCPPAARQAAPPPASAKLPRLQYSAPSPHLPALRWGGLHASSPLLLLHLYSELHAACSMLSGK